MKKKTIKVKEPIINNGHYHELLDRCATTGGIVEDVLLNHPLVETTPKYKKKIERAIELIAEVYVHVGDKAFN
jgi:hypothetical protein